ncbi:hypothetical protein AAMO2058_001747200 [Amorphochlora amoebiformis]
MAGLLSLFVVATSAIKLSNKISHSLHNYENAELKTLPEFYHDTKSLMHEFEKLQEDCPHMRLRKLESSDGVTLPVVDFDKGGRNKLKALFYFGEHARELISAESGLNFAEHLCLKHSTSVAVEKLLQNVRVRMIPVVNPSGKHLVHEGDWCHRTNAHNIDLNRNWDAHWEHNTNEQTNSGSKPFSESETQLLREDALSYKPDLFLTIHSGTLGLFTPWAYSSLGFSQTNATSLVETHQRIHKLFKAREHEHPSTSTRMKEMLTLLKKIDPKYCNCEAGAAGEELPYLSYGTSLDYMFDTAKVDYSFAFEIYDGRSNGGFKYSIEDRGYRSKHSCFAAVSQSVSDNPEECFAMFNPSQKLKYDQAVENWSTAYLDLLAGIVDIERKHGTL